MDNQAARFDPHVLDSLTNGNAALRSAVIASFLAGFPPQLSELTAAINRQDRRMARFYAHAVKGMSKQVGAESLRALAGQLETVVSNDVAAIAASTLVADISGEFDVLRPIMEKERSK